MTVTITTDSACDLFPDIYKKYNVEIVPLYINIAGKSYRDVFEIKPDNLFDDYKRTHILPKTSAPPPEDFRKLFAKCTENGGSVVHLAMNSKFSSSYQNACIAARNFENVYVVNTFTLSSAQGLLVIRAAELRDEGKTAKEIFTYLENAKKKVRAYVLLDTLEYAYRGGRASMLQMFGANLLKLKPCLLLDTLGELSVVKKFRGNFKQVCREYTRFVLSQPNPDDRRVFVSTVGMDKALFDEIAGMVRSSGHFKEVLTSRAGCAMSTHTGNNTLVIFYMEK